MDEYPLIIEEGQGSTHAQDAASQDLHAHLSRQEEILHLLGLQIHQLGMMITHLADLVAQQGQMVREHTQMLADHTEGFTQLILYFQRRN